MAQFDILLQGGKVYDPRTGKIEEQDVAVKDGVIAARGKNLPADAATVMDVTECIVSPGLIDMHCHIFPMFPYPYHDSLRTTNAEEHMPRCGVTTAVDAGTTGWRNFGDFKEHVIDATKVRVLAFIDIAAKGMHYTESEQAVADINPRIAAAVAEEYSDVVVGIKSAHYWAKPADAEHPIWASIDGALDAANRCGKIVMVDSIPIAGERPYPEILAHLRPGDVHTHVFAQQFPLMDEQGKMMPYMLSARPRRAFRRGSRFRQLLVPSGRRLLRAGLLAGYHFHRPAPSERDRPVDRPALRRQQVPGDGHAAGGRAVPRHPRACADDPS